MNSAALVRTRILRIPSFTSSPALVSLSSSEPSPSTYDDEKLRDCYMHTIVSQDYGSLLWGSHGPRSPLYPRRVACSTSVRDRRATSLVLLLRDFVPVYERIRLHGFVNSND
jgi:hypothetical protein